jgi:putative ABC transport system permease protein
MIATLARTLRSLRHSPGYVGVAALSLALGLGLSTATYAIMDSMMHPQIPLADVDRLFRERLRLGDQKHPPPIAEQMQALRTLPGVERVGVMASQQKRVVVGGADRYQFLSRMTPDFFAVLGVRAKMGRLPTDEEARTQSVVVLTASSWRQLFPQLATLEGAVITIDNRTYPVVGVLPAGIERIMQGGIWLPLTSLVELDQLRWPMILVKLRRGTDSIAVRPQLAVIAAHFTTDHASPGVPPYELQLHGVRPTPPNLRDNELALLMVGIAVGVLAIACANVAALSLARGLTRRRDHAVRIALGASRLAIGGEVLAEISVIAALGAAGGLLLAFALVGVLTHIVPEELTWAGYFLPELSLRVFVLTALTLLAGIAIAGGIPAWRASRANPADPLKDNAGTTTGRSRMEFKVLVIGELAISMALLMLASLMTLSTRNILNYEFGFDARRLLSANVMWSSRDSLTDKRKAEILEASLRRVQAMPGVVSVSTETGGGLDGGEVTSDAGREADPLRLKNYVEVGAGFFATIGVPVIEGRDFSEGDRAAGAIILSQRAAHLLFPHGRALGRMVKLGGERSTRPWLPVIGIARDVKLGLSPDPNAGADTLVYASTPNRSLDYERIVIRPARTDPALSLAILAALRDGLPPRSLPEVTPFIGYYDQMVRMHVFFDRLFSFLGTAALLLGAAGLFSVMSYAVGQRLREFAVRQALGATPRDVLRLVLRSGFELALGGTAIGALLSFWASAGVSAALFGVKNTDPISLVVAEGTLLLVTMLASLVPAIRAMRADPVEVLRAT